ncbi:DUF1206 domain-containing protein [Allosphingosinicella vermicomposti]|uniref:DUF1206 domain-containing protein n=1 Tax=Allosphingosinicella vermicomposti TaxID=614671 RepID=UPI000D0FEFD6|nr:DUF1206 domain-containing protein [Allosphingosinicella vermicomposti]
MISMNGMEAMTRLGFAARGVMYVLIGYLAIQTGRTEDGTGALQYLSSGAGRAILGLMALGFAGYAIWRLSEAVIDSEGNGKDAKGWAVRIGGAVSGLVHLGLGFYALMLALHMSAGDGGGAGAEKGAATALSLPGGPVLLTIAAIALAGTSLYQMVKAVRLRFLDHLDHEAAHQAWVMWIGRAGYSARGVVFLIMGWFLWRAAQSARAEQAGDMGQALALLPATLQWIVAAGLLLFGLFSFVEARYRRINNPDVIARLKGMGMAVRA